MGNNEDTSTIDHLGGRMSARAERIRDLLNEAIESANGGKPDNFNRWREQSRVALVKAVGESDPSVARFDHVRYTSGGAEPGFDVRAAGILQAVEIIRAAQTAFELESEEPEAPVVDIAGLHPWVSRTAASLWAIGKRRTAVEEAARSVEMQLREKLGVVGSTGYQLVQAFTRKSPGEPQLRVTDFGSEGSEPFKDAHTGAQLFGQGVFMRIRNLYTHGHEPSDAEALEALAALSLLARWIDDATVVRDPDEPLSD